MAYQTPARYRPWRDRPIRIEAKKSDLEIRTGCLIAIVSAKRINVARTNLMAKKYRESADSNPYFATTKPELQITIKIHGASEMTRFTVQRAP
jgi:hypothetical protein